MKVRRCLQFLGLLGCCLLADTSSDSSYEIFEAGATRLPQKLGVQESDWAEIRELIGKEEGVLVYVERNPQNQVGAWMGTKGINGLERRGPVFLYFKDQGRWCRSDEMSEWDERM